MIGDKDKYHFVFTGICNIRKGFLYPEIPLMTTKYLFLHPVSRKRTFYLINKKEQ